MVKWRSTLMASQASWALRLKVWSEAAVEKTDNLTNCWVIVDPPCIPFERCKTLSIAASTIRTGSTPWPW